MVSLWHHLQCVWTSVVQLQALISPGKEKLDFLYEIWLLKYCTIVCKKGRENSGCQN